MPQVRDLRRISALRRSFPALARVAPLANVRVRSSFWPSQEHLTRQSRTRLRADAQESRSACNTGPDRDENSGCAAIGRVKRTCGHGARERPADAHRECFSDRHERDLKRRIFAPNAIEFPGNVAEGEGFEPPEPLPVQWFSRPSKGGRGTSSSQFTPTKQAFSTHALGAHWGLSAPGHGQKADSLNTHGHCPVQNDHRLSPGFSFGNSGPIGHL
jgi:hypothetical protein